MQKNELKEILEKHKKWLNDEEGGERANLSYANLSYADLSYANLRRADLSYADLSGADLRNADLSGADLRDADLRGADLSGADLRNADLSGADLRDAYLSGADLRNADLSCAEGLPLTSDYLKEHFEFTADGMIAYKVFAGMYTPPQKWLLQPGAIITENVNFNRTEGCGCGINVAPLDWVRKNYPGETVWKLLIRNKWLCGIVVPYSTDGKIRCEKAEILGKIEDEEHTA